MFKLKMLKRKDDELSAPMPSSGLVMMALMALVPKAHCPFLSIFDLKIKETGMLMIIFPFIF